MQRATAVDVVPEPPAATTDEDLRGVGRRRLLRGSAAAVVGLLVADRVADGAPGSLAPLALPSNGDAVLRLEGQDVRARVVGGGPTAFASDGDQLVVSGELLLDGVVVGELHATWLHLVRSGVNRQRRTASTQQHVFHLEDGTIVGVGAGNHDDVPDEFAIVGGTGRFARATGVYAGVSSPLGLGGDGTARFDFDITLQGDRDA